MALAGVVCVVRALVSLDTLFRFQSLLCILKRLFCGVDAL